MVQDYFSGASLIPYIESIDDSKHSDQRHHHHHDDDDDGDDDSHRHIKTLFPTVFPVEQPSINVPNDSSGWFPWFEKPKPTQYPSTHTLEPTAKPSYEATATPSSAFESILPTLFTPTTTEPPNAIPSDSIRLPPAIDIGKIKSYYPTVEAVLPVETNVVVRDDGEAIIFGLTCLVAISIALFYFCSCYLRQLRKTWSYQPLTPHAFHRVSKRSIIHGDIERDPGSQGHEDFKVETYQAIE